MGRATERRRAAGRSTERLGLVLTYWSLFIAVAAAGLALIDTHVYLASLFFACALALLIVAMWRRLRLRARTKLALSAIALAVFGVADFQWIAYATAPSFPFVMPGVVLNPGQPDEFWTFFVVNRGRKPIYNLSVHFQDMDRTKAVTAALRRGLPPAEANGLIRTDRTEFQYRELDPNTSGGTDNQAARFFWHPGKLEDEHYDILLVHRNGTLREKLRVVEVGSRWQYAMRITDELTHRDLIACRDGGYPIGGEWRAEFPACFPGFPVKR